jgi:hypothetical protein
MNSFLMNDDIYWAVIVLGGAAVLAVTARFVVASPVFHNALYHVADFFLTGIEKRFSRTHVAPMGEEETPGWRPPR